MSYYTTCERAFFEELIRMSLYCTAAAQGVRRRRLSPSTIYRYIYM